MKWLLYFVVLFLCLLYVNSEENVNEHTEDYSDFSDDGVVSVEDEDINKENSVDENILEDHDYESPTIDSKKLYFAEHFDNKDLFDRNWVKSQAKKLDIAEEIAKYDGEWSLEKPKKQIWKNDLGLVLKSKAKHAAISSKLIRPFVFEEKPLIVQYEVTLQDGQVCGGSYLKLLSEGKEIDDLTKFNDKTPYTIMFGPDKCGNDIKLHFIFRHVNPINGSITEKHCRKPRERLEEQFKDKLPHLYQLILRPDNTFDVKVDHKIVIQGSLLSDFEPPINPPKDIEDPNDEKPKDWDEREKIPDPTAHKPEDWDENEPPQIPDPNAIKPADWLEDEPEMIPDLTAKKPDDWDADMDGEWEPPLVENPVCENAVGCGLWKAPLIPNPNYKGKWRAPLIDNPNYQGKWIPKKIPNPHFFEDLQPFKMTTISAVGIEIWSMSGDILFDNIIITDDIEVANEWAEKTFDLKRKHIDKDSAAFFGTLMKLTNENPILWGVYILVVGVPLVFVFYMLSGKRKDEQDKKEQEAKAKKTDEPTEDDTVSPSVSEQNESNEDNNLLKTGNDSEPKLNNSNEDDESEKEVEENQNIEDDNINNVIENLGETEEINSQTESVTRKRKSRKE